MRFFSVRLCKVWLLVAPSFGMYCIELPTQHDDGDVELSTYASSIKGPLLTLKQRAAAVLVQDIARLSKIDQKAARKKLEKTLSVLPSECWEYIEEALWCVHDPCIVRNNYKQPVAGAYDRGVGYAVNEVSFGHVGYARLGISSGGVMSDIVDYDTGAREEVSDLVVTRVDGNDQKHTVDLFRSGIFSGDGRYVAFITHPHAADRAHIPYVSVYDSQEKLWRSIAFDIVSASFIDDHCMVCCFGGGFSLVDCAATDLSVQKIVSLSDQPKGLWSPFGEGFVRLVKESIVVYTPQTEGWQSASYKAPCSITRCSIARQRSILGCLHSQNDEGFLSFVKIANGSCDVVSRIGITSCYAASGPTDFSFFGKEQLCALGFAGRGSTLIVSCVNILNPQIIKKLDTTFSAMIPTIGHKVYSGGAIIMPNVLLSYYAAYKKKLTQQKASSCILS